MEEVLAHSKRGSVALRRIGLGETIRCAGLRLALSGRNLVGNAYESDRGHRIVDIGGNNLHAARRPTLG